MIGKEYDLCVIGGGINGAGIARDAAGRGLSVLLVEAKDLAQGTSSASSKLIHGGLRYLEFFEFKMVRDALMERERLLSIAPHLIRPMRFILPFDKGIGGRPAWMVRLGLFLYDHLARRKRIEGSDSVDLAQESVGWPLKDQFKKGFSYYDCWADDSRLVALNALDAFERGAKVLTRTKCTKIEGDGDRWRVELCNEGGAVNLIHASMVVNAAGPWTREVLEASGLETGAPRMRLVKGSHIIIKRAFEGDQAYILQQNDKRIVFALPYENDYTLIGTTEEPCEGDLYDVRITDDEVSYLCAAFSAYFEQDIKAKDVVWAYSGVRPLFEDGSEDARSASRDFYLYTHPHQSLPIISVFGGKLTTYRVVAEQVLNKLLHLDSRYSNPWTADEPLPGGDFPDGHFAVFVAEMRRQYPWLSEALLYRYAQSYGSRMERFLDGAHSLKDLGCNFGSDVYEAELLYLAHYEWAKTPEDALFRRSKLGLHISEATWEAIEKAWPDILKGGKND